MDGVDGVDGDEVAVRERAERFEYVFGGTVDPDTWAEADEDERAALEIPTTSSTPALPWPWFSPITQATRQSSLH